MTEKKYMMATKAYHKLGDISSDVPDLCVVKRETETDWYGSWVTDFGIVDVRFPKETTRELTTDEINNYNAMYVQIVNPLARKLTVN